MFFWSGLGYLVPVITFGMLVFAEMLSRALTRNLHFYQDHDWPRVLALICAAAILWFWGLSLHKKGQQKHAFLGILVHYWTPIPLLLGIVGALSAAPAWQNAETFDASCLQSCRQRDGEHDCMGLCSCVRQKLERRYQSWPKLLAVLHTDKDAFDQEMKEVRGMCGSE